MDIPVAPGMVLTSFDTFGRAGWLRVHALNANLGTASVGIDVIEGEVSELATVSERAASRQAVAAVNGDYFDITETNAPEGPEISSGQLLKATDQPTTVATVGTDRIARIADLLLAGTVTVAGPQRPLAALNSEVVPADGIAVFTPLWGSGDRTDIQSPGPYTELIVTGGQVTAINSQLTSTAVPDNGLIVLGQGAAATALATATAGDTVAVTFAPQSDVPVPLQMALGSGAVLVSNGTAVTFESNPNNDALEPRTAIGWLDGGTRILLVAVDGKANFSAGLGYNDMAALMVRLGATEAYMLDGGGSTEIVARHPGNIATSVINTPSDGNERLIANAVGLFGPRGSGKVRALDVRPGADRVVPGLTMDVAAAGYDEVWGPANVGAAEVGWTASPGSLGKVTDGVFRAESPGAGTLRAHAGLATGTHELRVVGRLHKLAFSELAVTVDPGETAAVSVIGADADGFASPVRASDVTLGYDKTVISVTLNPDGSLTITGGSSAAGSATSLTATAQGVTAALPVTVGLVSESLAEFESTDTVTWTATTARANSASVAIVAADDRPGAAPGNHVLQLSYDFTGQPSTSAAYAVANPTITLPSGTEKLSLWVNGDGQGHWLRAMIYSQGTTNVPFTFANSVDWTGWQQVTGDIPAGFADPLTLLRVYYVETSQSNKNAGQIEFDSLAALVGDALDTTTAPRPDPYVVQQGGLPTGRWIFAMLSDLHISAAQTLDSFSGRQAVKALQQVVAANPEFIIINGDFVDDDNPADFALANGLLSDYVPSDLPVYWTPGNHEAGLSSTGPITEFLTATGRPNRQVFDHKGTRFILLDSHTGDMRTSDWDQVPGLQAELAGAATDPTVTGVIVSFHHPLVDPTGTGASQISDQLEASLFKQWLADFRESSGKPIALFTGHAHDAAVNRADGVLEVNTPAVGKTPYASPDQGGFFGWMLVGVDPQPAPIRAGLPSPQTRDWLQAESIPLIDEITLSVPGQLAAGASTAVSASGITSEFGLTFPLRFPASVTWGGGTGVVAAATAPDVSGASQRKSTLAVLDLTAVPTLRAIRPGTVTVTAASGGLTASATVTLT